MFYIEVLDSNAVCESPDACEKKDKWTCCQGNLSTFLEQKTPASTEVKMFTKCKFSVSLRKNMELFT